MKELVIAAVIILSTTLYQVQCTNFFMHDELLMPLVLGNSSLVMVSSDSNIVHPGVDICIKSRLNLPLKKNTIYIGVVGTHLDPLLAHIHEHDIHNSNGSGCSINNTEVCPLPG